MCVCERDRERERECAHLHEMCWQTTSERVGGKFGNGGGQATGEERMKFFALCVE